MALFSIITVLALQLRRGGEIPVPISALAITRQSRPSRTVWLWDDGISGAPDMW
jgi:hypothetical protein